MQQYPETKSTYDEYEDIWSIFVNLALLKITFFLPDTDSIVLAGQMLIAWPIESVETAVDTSVILQT